MGEWLFSISNCYEIVISNGRRFLVMELHSSAHIIVAFRSPLISYSYTWVIIGRYCQSVIMGPLFQCVLVRGLSSAIGVL